jgi:hypothetical protein
MQSHTNHACPCDAGDAPNLNLLQVVALNAVACGSVTALARSLDLGWGLSLLAGWIGGAVLTFSVLAMLLVLGVVLTRRQSAPTPTAPDAAARKAAILSAWEADLRAELTPGVHEAWEVRRRAGRRGAPQMRRAA